MTTPYPFQTGATLLSSQMNSLSELPVRSITASSTAIATDRYSRVIANGSAITYTLPSGVFEAGQVVQFHNINSTAATIAAGAGVTLNAAAGTTVAQYQAATIYAAGTASFVMFESDGPATSTSGLVRVAGGSFTTATSVSFPNDTFTATYDNYVCMIRVDTLTADATFSIRLRAAGSDNTNSDYWRVIAGSQVSSTSWSAGEGDTTPRYFLILNLLGPKLTARTGMFQQQFNINQAGNAYAYNDGGGVFDATTSFDSASFISSVASSMTGSYNVYGYSLS